MIIVSPDTAELDLLIPVRGPLVLIKEPNRVLNPDTGGVEMEAPGTTHNGPIVVELLNLFLKLKLNAQGFRREEGIIIEAELAGLLPAGSPSAGRPASARKAIKMHESSPCEMYCQNTDTCEQNCQNPAWKPLPMNPHCVLVVQYV